MSQRRGICSYISLLIFIHRDIPLEGLWRRVPGASPDLNLGGAAHDDVVELLADHPEQPVQIHVEVVQVPLVRADVVVLLKEGVGQLRDDGIPVDVDDRLVAGLLLDDLEGTPGEVLRRDPPDVAVPLAEVAQEDERIPDLLQRLSVLRPSLPLLTSKCEMWQISSEVSATRLLKYLGTS